MADITQEITLYTGDAPNRNSQPNAVYSANADFFAGYFSTTPPEYNTFATQANALRVEVNTSKDDAAVSAGLAESYKDLAAATANFKGDWSGLTGALNIPSVVAHNGSNWQLLTNLADVTASEPSLVNGDWLFQNGTKWNQITASGPAYANGQYYVYATGVAVDITQPTFSPSDYIVVSNSPQSTQTVRLLNPSNTIYGKRGTASAGDNIILKAGETIHIVARTASILGVVS